jgi:hypothetical protein
MQLQSVSKIGKAIEPEIIPKLFTKLATKSESDLVGNHNTTYGRS